MRSVFRGIKLFFAALLFFSGCLRLLRFFRREKGNFRILMYHHVSERDGIPPSVFRRQMAYVSRHYAVVELSELLKQKAEGKSFPQNAIAVTFDDGHRDFLSEAYPVLKEMEIPATLFAVVDCLDQKPLRRTSKGMSVREGLEDHCAEKGHPMLNWEELLSLSQDGVEIGAHTVSHPILTRIPPEEAMHEIRESKSVLEERLGKSVRLFCYPNGEMGDFNPEIENMVQEAGYIGACTTIEGKNDGGTNPYALKRFAVWERSLPVFACELEGVLDPFHRLSDLVRKEGIRAIFKALSERIWATRTYLIFERAFGTRPHPPRVIGTYTFEWLKERDVAQLTHLQDDLTLEKIRQRFSRGDRCFVARKGKRIVSFVWVAEQPTTIWDIRGSVPLRPSQFYIYNGRTVPSYRGLGIHPVLLREVEKILGEKGGKSYLGAVHPGNRPSIRSFMKDGFMQTGYVLYRRRLFWTQRRDVRFNPKTPISAFHIVPLRRVSAMTPVVVIGQGRTGLAADRLLGKRGIPVIKVTDDASSLGGGSRYGQLEHISIGDTERFLLLLKRLWKNHRASPVLIPTSDEGVRWLSEERDLFQEKAKCLMPEKRTIEILLDKGLFAEEAARLGFSVPHTKKVETGEDIRAILREQPFPCVLKPSHPNHLPQGGIKAVWISGPEAFERISRRILEEKRSFLVQEAIPGDDSLHWSCAAYLDPTGEVLAQFSAKKIRQYPPVVGIASLCESRWNAEVSDQAVSLLKKLRYVGVAEVEFKEDPRDGALKVIEVNPRLWIQHPLAARCGIDFAYMLYLGSLGVPFGPVGRQRDGARWIALDLDLLTAWKLLRKGEISVPGWLGAYRFPIEPGLFQWRDPGPGFYRMGEMVSSFIKRRFL